MIAVLDARISTSADLANVSVSDWDIEEGTEVDLSPEELQHEEIASCSIDDERWTTESSSIDEEATAVVRAPTPTPNVEDLPNQIVVVARKFRVLQQWEGVVTEVNDRTFVAILSDLAPKSTAKQVIELLNTRIDTADRDLIVPGNVFYLVAGFDVVSGTIRNKAEIRFRRLPKWTQQDISAAVRSAKELLEELTNGADEGHPTEE